MLEPAALEEEAGAEPGLPAGEKSRSFGDYELLELIARGGMGVVYRARHRALHRVVALKMIRAGEFASEAERQRFQAEAEAAAHLDHPNIVPVYEVGEHDGQHYFAMKLVEGGSLAQRMANSPSLITNDETAQLLATIARAVHYAHQRGVLHRDLKPANILLDAHAEPFVSDFGLAKRLETSLDLTLSGAIIGTPNYMSPEQAAGRSQEITTAADIYSLGAILYELLAGQPPFQADTTLATMRMVVEEEPVPPSRLARSSQREEAQTSGHTTRSQTKDQSLLTSAAPKEVDRDLETICLKCLQKQPAQRYATAQALTEDLERWLRHEPIQARPITVRERMVKWTRRHPARAGLVAVSVAAVVGFVILLLVSGQKLQRERNVAIAQEGKARTAATRAEAGERAAQERAYAADIYAAFQALAVDDLALARRLLNEHRPGRIPNEEFRMTKGIAAPTLRSNRGHEAQTQGNQSLLTSAATSVDLRGFEWRVLWERTRGQETFAFTNLARPADCLVFAPDGRTLVSGGDDGIHLWDIAERRPLDLFPGPDPGRPSGDRAATTNELRPLLDASPALVEHLKVQPGLFDYLDAFGHTNRTRAVTSLTFTPDGQHLLVGSIDLVRSWNLATRTFDFAIPEKEARVAMPPVGDLFVVANNQNVAPDDERRTAHQQSTLLYSFTRRRLVAELPGYGLRAVISPDGQYVAAAGRTNGAVLWRPATGETTVLGRNPSYNEVRYSMLLSFSPDGRTLLLRSDNRRHPLLWDVASKRIKAYLNDERVQVGAVAWSPDGRWLAGGGENQNIGLWQMPQNLTTDLGHEGPPFLVPQTILLGHEDTVTALAYSPDGRWLTSAANDHSIRLWVMTDTPARVPIARSDSMRDFTLDAETGCVVARAGGQLTVWDSGQGYAPRPLPGTERHFHAGFLDRGQGFVAVEMATNGVPVSLEIRGLPEGAVQTRREILPAPRELQSSGSGGTPHLAASPDGQWLAVPQNGADREPDVHVFSIVTGRFITRLPSRTRAIPWNLRASPDSRWLVRLDHQDGENRIMIYDTQNWQVAQEISFRSADNDIYAAAIDPASRLLATGGMGENSLRVWDLLTGRLAGHCNGNVLGWHPVWSRDSRTLVVRDTGGLRLWSMVVFRELATLPLAWHHTHMPLGFTADGRALVTHLFDGRVTAWSPPRLTEIDLQP